MNATESSRKWVKDGFEKQFVYTLFSVKDYATHFYIAVSIILLFIFGIYLWLVIVVLPKFMKFREPFNVTALIRIYDIFQIIVCSIYVTRAYRLGFTPKYLWSCEKFETIDYYGRIEVKVGYWLFLLLRIAEFLETIFFVLRKKQKQASFLHIFHHIGSVSMTWLFIVSDAGKVDFKL